MTLRQHVIRVALLMVAVAGLIAWLHQHTESTFADGLRYIHQAERLDHGEWTRGLVGSIDHPMHALAIFAAHRVVGGEGPVAWQHAAQTAALLALVLTVIPLYLVGLELYDANAAWVGCALYFANPMTGYIAVNVLSETTFLFFWTWGLWAAIRFLREGRTVWLAPTVVFAALAYGTRPEGMLLPIALTVVLLASPSYWATRLSWPRWWAAVAIVIVGPLALAGPYMLAKGRIDTKPAVGRVLGLAPHSPPLALERDRPLPSDQTTAETYMLAFKRVNKVMRNSVTAVLIPFAILGILLSWSSAPQARAWLFQGIMLALSVVALIRLHATGGYCTVRHAIVPGMILILAGAHGLSVVLKSAIVDGRLLGRPREFYRLGPAFWALALVILIAPGHLGAMGSSPGSFTTYHTAGRWIATQTAPRDRVLDMTDWSLYFSGRDGYILGDVDAATADPKTRWIIVRDIHLERRSIYTTLLKHLINGRKPVAAFPGKARPNQVRILVFDRDSPSLQNASASTDSARR